MHRLRINLILPFPVTKPVGGARVMYEYANRLHEKGHEVRVFHSIKRPYKKSSTPLWYKQLAFALRGVARPKWFPLNRNIKSVIVPSITNKYIPDADISMSTWWQMTYALNELSPSKGKKFNLIQDYEIWGTADKQLVDASFSLPIHHLVIARYLQQLVTEKNNGVIPALVPNAIDSREFYIEKAIATRSPHNIIMLYSEEARKGTATGLEALQKVHAQFPDLRVQLFGVYPQPDNLPSFCLYARRPENLRSLYNDAAIFFSPSLQEGFGLPAAEAMACGCAVVCTNTGGHPDFAIDQQTALLTIPGNAEDMAQKLSLLLKDTSLKLKLATAGNENINNAFSWQTSVKKLEECFYTSLKK